MARESLGAGRALLIGLGVVGAAAATAFAATAAVSTYFARTVLTPPRRKAQEVRVLAVDREAGRITLSATPDSVLPGRYGLWVDGDTAHARLGEILSVDELRVVRELRSIDYGEITAGLPARIDSWWFLSPAELELDYEEVTVHGELGANPAWYFPAERSTWVVAVHGWTASRGEMIRAVPVLHRQGLPVLIASYRNDGEAPFTDDRRYALGDTEWRDAEAAVQYALDHGAEKIVLMGFSMGGAISLQTVLRSELGDSISGLILDSPVIDWVDTLHYQAEAHRLPQAVREGVFGMMSQPWGRPFTGQHAPLDLDGLNTLTRAEELDVPILILHSDDDGFVPASGSRELAALRPDLVTFVAFEEARHVKLWNYDEERWDSAVAGWLEAHELL